jgi:hypothetical protein
MSKRDEIEAETLRLINEEVEDELARLRLEIFGQCHICHGNVTEYDMTYGSWGGEFRGEACYHSVCLSGKLAVSA